ncbi:macro domain-containing protein [Oribacterium sp. FC2011]|uniref:macro domain-containing protein n=1 Tax=Oribacterium sp. FC2011 TaxID=1408311 RepID=UPI0004E1297A|nr:macro domain-containing protein [Oribacterium sp. FC2011]
MSSIDIKKISITKLDTDAIVNAANEGLWQGGGVCGAIFRDAGSQELTKACNAIGGCKTGNAVITPGFNLPAKYVIHAVGPRWTDGNHDEPKLLYSAYKQSLILAKENKLHSIGFPLISAGIFGYPLDGAWRKAIQACNDFIKDNLDYDIKIIFAVLDDKILAVGEKTLKDIV